MILLLGLLVSVTRIGTFKNKELRGTFGPERGGVGWVPVMTAWRVLGLRMQERPPALEGSCEYVE
jgi:hypothetical protein